jgi:hypothetical protein
MRAFWLVLSGVKTDIKDFYYMKILFENFDLHTKPLPDIGAFTTGIYGVEEIGGECFCWVSPKATIYLKCNGKPSSNMVIDIALPFYEKIEFAKPAKVEFLINDILVYTLILTNSKRKKLIVNLSENKLIKPDADYYKIDIVMDVVWNPSNSDRDLALQLFSITFIEGYSISEICPNYRENIARLFKAVEPKNIDGHNKIRVGSDRDGGYIMLEPRIYSDNSGIAYSFGIENEYLWDLQMSQRGYQVYQYDGTVDNPSQEYPLLHFYKFNICGTDKRNADEKTVKEIIAEHHHTGKDIILQMDIEGSEWEVFQYIDEESITQFEQMIVEFHGIAVQGADFLQQIEILEKLNRTHQVIHVHGNNYAPAIPLDSAHSTNQDYMAFLKHICFLPTVLEVTYVRKINPVTKNIDYKFSPCFDVFPSLFDNVNCKDVSDIYIGRFNAPSEEIDRIDQIDRHLIAIEQNSYKSRQFTWGIAKRLGQGEGARGELEARVAQGEEARGELEARVAQGENARETLEARVAQGENARETLEARVAQGEEARGELEARVAQGEDARETLEARVARGEDARSELEARVAQGEEARSELEARVAQGENARETLEARVAQGEEARSELEARVARSVKMLKECLFRMKSFDFIS